LVLIDFYADWCMPCVMMGPIINDISEKFKGKVKVGKVIDQFIGSISEEELENKLNGYL